VHPQHRFAALYEPILAPRSYPSRHIGIYCDGPLCQNKHDYIEGVRYKCAICHDTDFCANCEAYPHNKHNRTHPLIKLKTSVRNVSVTTLGENKTMGDHTSFANASAHRAASNAATQVQTIVDVKPAEATYRPLKEKIEIKDLLAEPIQEKIKVQDLLSSPNEEPKHATPVDVTKLQAKFIRETIPDETLMQPGMRFTQVWTLRNIGTEAWPAGCSVRYTGGDNMLNVEKNAPFAITEIAEATETNVMSRPVEVGEEISFRVTMKAPLSDGTKISYWRLKTADGQAFGHRLWCHINVAKAVATKTADSSSFPEVSSTFSPATIPTVERNEDVGRPSLRDNFLQTVLQQRIDRRREMELSAEMHKRIEKAMALQNSRADVELVSRAQMLRNLSAEIHAVEVQHKAKVAAAKAAIDAAKVAKKEAEPSELPAPSEDASLDTIWLLKERSRRMEAGKKQDKADVMAAVAAVGQAQEVEASIDSSSVQNEVKIEGSEMIFPTLEKESPASSTHDLAAPTTLVATIETTTNVAPPTANSEVDIFDDAESVEFVDSDSEAGFLTDEEYDILDASDEETLA
jgi:next-to-BRCA1 protein 1